jgi:transposase-like protein
MALEIIRDDNRFRFKGQGISCDWLPDTLTNRKSTLVFLRQLTDEAGKSLFTYQELAQVVGSSNRQAACNHIRDFRDCGEDFLAFLSRRKKLDSQVVSAIREELLKDPLASCPQLQPKVNARLGRDDLSVRNLEEAMDLIPVRPFRQAIQRQLAKGEVHYQEQYLLSEMMTSLSPQAGLRAGIAVSDPQGMTITDPTAIKTLVNPETPLASRRSPLKWVSFLMVLYYHGVPLSVLGKWVNVHKTTVLRWILAVSLELWPLVAQWLVHGVNGTMVYIDEKWMKIKGKWYYWFVVFFHSTGLPLLGSLLATRSQWACRWIGVQLKRLGKLPTVIITDGLLSYSHVLEGAKHLTCLFHHQQGVTRWLKKHFSEKEKIHDRKSQMKKVFQTQDKRTVKRRWAKLKGMADTLQITEWVKQTEQDLPKLLPQVGSQRLPTTTNAIERFFRAFHRFYKVRCGFFSVVSAKRELIFFLVMYLFVRQPETGKAPLETILPQAKQMPFYLMVNDPLSAVMGLSVNLKGRMADFQPQQVVATQM